VDIGGQPPIPTRSNTNVILEVSFFYLGSFFLPFWVLNFLGCFAALNNVFWALHIHIVNKVKA